MSRYPNVSDHGLIDDLETAALVTTDGVLDWFCCPRFDSPSVFASLLDAERGGFTGSRRTGTTTCPGAGVHRAPRSDVAVHPDLGTT
jgi:GH15 family glucan-1,4-alpha-glucosidase